MKLNKSVLTLVVSAFLASSAVMPANATGPDPILNTLPSFSLTGTTVAANPGGWVNGSTYRISGDPILQAFACGSSKDGTTQTQFSDNYQFMVERSSSLSGCAPLYQDQAATAPFSSGDLTSAYLKDFGVFAYPSKVSTKPHILMLSYVNAEYFSNPSLTMVRFGYSASQEFSLPAPTADVQPTVSLNGNVLTVVRGTWTNAVNTPTTNIYACADEQLEIITPSSSQLVDFGAGCAQLFASQNYVDFSGTSLDLSTAFTRTATWVPYLPNPALTHIFAVSQVQVASGSIGVRSVSVEFGESSAPDSPASSDVTRPYTGPIIQAPGAIKPVAPGAKLVIPGSNLTGVSKVTIDGKDAAVKVNSAGELELTVPAGLAAGSYDLVVNSDSGVLTVQGAIVVSGSAVVAESIAKPSTKLKDDNTVKVWVFDVAGAGKVQVKLNGKEVAWVNTTDANDRKLTNGYLVRTLTLSEGKNVIEVFVDGKRVDRKAYTN